MPTATTTFESVDLIYWIYSGGLPMPDPTPEITYTGPVDGVWTIDAPESVTQEQLDAGVAAFEHNNIVTQNMQTLFDKIAAAVPTNRDFLDIPAPTTEETASQVQALTRQINALLILRTGDFTDISGT